jgi:hypothetical protein
MLVKVHYSGGYSGCVGSKFFASVSLAEYINFQFQADEYSLNCESIEINFRSELVSYPARQLAEMPLTQKPSSQKEKAPQNRKALPHEKICV